MKPIRNSDRVFKDLDEAEEKKSKSVWKHLKKSLTKVFIGGLTVTAIVFAIKNMILSGNPPTAEQIAHIFNFLERIDSALAEPLLATNRTWNLTMN